MADIRREGKEQRLVELQLLARDVPTRYLRDHIRAVVYTYEQALKRPDDFPNERLNMVYDDVMDHWKDIYGDRSFRASLLMDLVMYMDFLVGKLREDWLFLPFEVSRWLLDIEDIVSKQDATTSDSGKEPFRWSGRKATSYSKHFGMPIAQMLLEPEQVKKKLHAAASMPGSEILRLIHNRDWPALAQAAFEDSKFAQQLFDGQPRGFSVFGRVDLANILHGIDSIQDLYFAGLSDPSTFTLTERAERLSSGLPIPSLTPAPSVAIGPKLREYFESERSSLESVVSNVYGTITNKTGKIGSKTIPRAYSSSSTTENEKAPLLDRTDINTLRTGKSLIVYTKEVDAEKDESFSSEP